MGKEYMYGVIIDDMKEIGNEIKCMVKVKLLGLMEDLMKESIYLFIIFFFFQNKSYEDDKKHGHGTFIWNDGRKYIGEWRKGK